MSDNVTNLDNSPDGYSAVHAAISKGLCIDNAKLEETLATAYKMVDHPKRKRLFTYCLYGSAPTYDPYDVLRRYDELVWLVR